MLSIAQCLSRALVLKTLYPEVRRVALMVVIAVIWPALDLYPVSPVERLRSTPEPLERVYDDQAPERLPLPMPRNVGWQE